MRLKDVRAREKGEAEDRRYGGDEGAHLVEVRGGGGGPSDFQH